VSRTLSIFPTTNVSLANLGIENKT